MYIVVSNDRRIPLDLAGGGYQIEQWTLQEFVDNASSDDGLDVDEGIYYDVSVLTQDIYEALVEYKEYGITIIYYRFDDTPMPSFSMQDDIAVYATRAPEPELEPEPEPVPEPEPEPELVFEPAKDEEPVKSTLDLGKEPYVPPVQPAYQTPVQPAQPAPQPVYNQPAPQPVQPAAYQVPTQPAYQPEPPVYQPTYQAPQEPTPSYSQPVDNTPKSSKKMEIPGEDKAELKKLDKIMKMNFNNLLQHDDFDGDTRRRKKKAPAKVVLFGSSKGGTGKTFTCLAGAYWYAKKHPTEKVALADFDIIDGQIGITINKLSPTMQEYYRHYKAGQKDFAYLENCKVKTEHFSPNIDFYLAPSQDIPQVTNNITFWNELFMSLINNYDVVFFDSGIDYLGKPPISQLYKIADKIIITSNPSINSVKSVIKQMKTLSGNRQNDVFKPSDKILKRTNIVLTRMYEDGSPINDVVLSNLQKFAPVIATFGNIDKVISEIQWYQHWYLIDNNPKLYTQLDKIIDLKGTNDIDDDDDSEEE